MIPTGPETVPSNSLRGTDMMFTLLCTVFTKAETKLYKEVENLKKRRAAEFANKDETEYYRLHRRIKSLLQRDLNNLLRLDSDVALYGYVPATQSCYGYVRYETLPDHLRDQIVQRYSYVHSKNFYQIKNGPFGKCLRDLVEYLESKS